MRNLLRFTTAALILCALPAHAVSKETIQLQAQIQQLQEAVARLQQSNDERMGVLKDLVQQTADSVNRMSLTVGALQQKVVGQTDAASTKSDQISGQIQSLNDSIDELKARMARMDKVLGNVESQQQSTNALLQSLPAAAPATNNPPPAAATSSAPSADTGGLATSPAPKKTLPAPQARPSAGEMYRAAYSEYMAAHYPLASSEFTDLATAYPDDNLTGNAFYYLGEIDSRSARPSAAVKNYDRVLEHFPDNVKIPAAHLHKGEAMLSMKQTDAGVRELRALIQRFPNSPEAAQARTRLATLGVAATVRK